MTHLSSFRYAGLTLLLVTQFVLPTHAQKVPEYHINSDYTVRHWSVLDGLPSNAIEVLIQTSDGYLWLGTNDGLARFDGHSFQNFNVINTPELGSNRITRLQEAPAGHLWIADESGGLSLLYNNTFIRLPVNTGGPTSNSFVYAEEDTVWVESKDGLWRYVSGKLERYRPDLFDSEVTAVQRDGEGRLWVGTLRDGLYCLSGTRVIWHFEEAVILDLLLDTRDRIWVDAGGRILRVDEGQLEVVHDQGEFGMEYMDHLGNIWINADQEGWWRHAPSDERMLIPLPPILTVADRLVEGMQGVQWRHGSTGTRGVEENMLFRNDTFVFGIEDYISTTLPDRQGNVWIGAWRNGLYQIQPALIHTYGEEVGIPYKSIYPVLEDRTGNIWLGTFGRGLVRLDTLGSSHAFLPEETGAPEIVRSLYEDHAGTIWAGGYGFTCWIEEDQCRSDLLPDIVNVDALVMYEDVRRRFWIGGNKGLVVREQVGTVQSWRQTSIKSPVRVILETSTGDLLFGTNGDGLFRYTASDSFEVFIDDNDLPSNRITDLYEDHTGAIWIAFESHGLCRLTPSVESEQQDSLFEDNLHCLDSSNGLYQSGLHRIIEDDFGRFWFGTKHGIFWVEIELLNAFLDGDLSSVPSVSYTEVDGMRRREVNGGMQPAGTKARDGRLWFPTEDGVVVIDPANVSVLNAPAVQLEEIQVDGDVRFPETDMQLAAAERDISFHYSANEFQRADDVRFQYYLENYDTSWHDGGKIRQASYTNLPPGTYTFHVRAGLGGEWSKPASIQIKRSPYFWQTIWFYGLTSILSVFVGYAFYAMRVRGLKMHEIELEGLVAERTTELREANEIKSRFLANISHEFRTPLTLTFGPLDDALSGRFNTFNEARPYFESARRNGSRLLRLINQLLDLSKLDAGAHLLQTHRFDLAQHLYQIAALFESFAETKGVSFSLKISETPVLFVYDADKLEKVIINLLSNAFKFTSSGEKVSLMLEEMTEGISIVIADTGRGIPEKDLPLLFNRFFQVDDSATRIHEGTGIGLALAKELIELHEGQIEVESTEGFGARFIIQLPTSEPQTPNPQTLKPSSDPTFIETTLQDLGIPTQIPQYLTPPNPNTPKLQHPNTPLPLLLVIEDNPDMRMYIRGHLGHTFTVLEAENGREGLAQAFESIPDLILSDVMMPEMDGLEVCAAIKADERTSHIPVVLLTARAQVEHRIAGYESGADAYLPKPFNAQELQVRVRTLIEERRRIRESFAASADYNSPVPESDNGVIKEEPVLPPQEAAFLKKMEAIIKEQLGNSQFGLDQMAEEAMMSRRQLQRKMQALTNEGPTVMLRRMRLSRAAELLKSNNISVKEVCFEVGFKSKSSFARTFRETYGMSPSEYQQA